MKQKLLSLAVAACSMIGVVAGAELAGAPGAQAIANRCDPPKVSGPNASVRCAGPGSFNSFQFSAYCYDGISDYRYEVDSAWLPFGSTAHVACGAPQRQYIKQTWANFR